MLLLPLDHWLLVDLISKALGGAIPARVTAGHYADSCLMVFAGTDPRTGNRLIIINAHVGGWGAWEGSDGTDVSWWSAITRTEDLPIEVLETKFPLRIARYACARTPAVWAAGEEAWASSASTRS